MGRNRVFLSVIFLFLISLSCNQSEGEKQQQLHSEVDSLHYAREVHLKNIQQLTFGGNNAEAYFSFDNRKLIFQSDWEKINPQGCDQIFVLDLTKRVPTYQMVSTGKGRTTCSYFLKDGRIIYASTHGAADTCPQAPRVVNGKYVWPIFPDYDIYVADSDGKNPTLLIGGPGYDAEATVSPDGRYIVWTSVRSGDLELWRYDLETGEMLQLTDELGYDGGAFFSPDGQYIVWRASRPKDTLTYKQLLAQNLVQPTELNIFIMKADGSEKRQVTHLPGANWAPFFHPSGKKIIFSSNHHTLKQGGRIFNLFMVNLDGSGLEQITFSKRFDAFPMFSFDGKKLVFASNRNGKSRYETNVFIADWVE